MPNSFVITGFGRSGTSYISRVLNGLDIRCGHESVYRLTGEHWSNLWDGDASWLAVPFLDGFDGPIIHLTRDPGKVVESMAGMGLFSNFQKKHWPYQEFARRYTGCEEDPVTFMEVWANRIDRLATGRIKLEELDVIGMMGLLDAIGWQADPMMVAGVLSTVSKQTNSRPREVDSPRWDVGRVRRLQARYGY